jgi:serine/threonine protein kinase
MSRTNRQAPPPLTEGSVVNDRYEIQKSLGKGGMGEVFLAYDRTTQQSVALKVVREETRMPGDDEALRQELVLARSVSHPHVCRVHDLAPSPWGPIMVMEHIAGQTLHTHIRRTKTREGYRPDEFRKIASEAGTGLSAIHAQGLIHGDLKPGNVMVTDERAIILDFGFAQERARINARRPGAPPDGGTPNYMSPERIRSGGASPEDDMYALGLTLWEMWTCRVPEPGSRPRSKPMRAQIMFDVPAGLSVDEIKQIYRCLSESPTQRPAARHLRFFNPTALTTSQTQIQREKLSPGTPPGRGVAESFTPGAQSLLVTYASNAGGAAGRLYPLNKPTITLGRRGDQDLVFDEATVSGAHAVLRWRAGSWVIQDEGSTNGTYADHSYERRNSVSLMHGNEVQLGECRVKLVNFIDGSPQHARAKDYLHRFDGLTGLLLPHQFQAALEEELGFANWAAVPLSLAKYRVVGPNRAAGGRPTILEMLAVRRAAQRVVELTETLLLSIVPLTAGRTGALEFTVAMTGPSQVEAQTVVEQVIAQVQGLLPGALELEARLVGARPDLTASQLLEA